MQTFLSETVPSDSLRAKVRRLPPRKLSHSTQAIVPTPEDYLQMALSADLEAEKLLQNSDLISHLREYMRATGYYKLAGLDTSDRGYTL